MILPYQVYMVIVTHQQSYKFYSQTETEYKLTLFQEVLSQREQQIWNVSFFLIWCGYKFFPNNYSIMHTKIN